MMMKLFKLNRCENQDPKNSSDPDMQICFPIKIFSALTLLQIIDKHICGVFQVV